MPEYQENEIVDGTEGENKRDINKKRRRAGRTILIKANQDYKCDFDGIISTAKTENGSKFLVFDTIDNSKNAFKLLKDENIKAKFSYYKMFFKIKSELVEDITYDDLKTMMLNEMSVFHKEVNILYFKLYTRQGKLTGSGDLVLDTKDDLDKFVGQRTLKLNKDDLEVRMFRFIMKNHNEELKATR